MDAWRKAAEAVNVRFRSGAGCAWREAAEAVDVRFGSGAGVH